jgi:hypothetical protein
MMQKRLLRGDNRGIGAVEFALIAPVLISFIVGISQLGKLFFANADMKNASAAGARLASIYPTPADATIISTINGRLVRTEASAHATPAVTHGTDGSGNPYIEIRMTYSVPLDFIFFRVPSVTLHDTRRVFTQVAQGNSTNITTTSSTTGGTTSTTSGTTSSTTTGGTTSTTGGTTSSTSASSTGGTTSSTSATSASSTSSTSTTSSTTSSSGNASSGNNNGSSSSNGHGHGNCPSC